MADGWTGVWKLKSSTFVAAASTHYWQPSSSSRHNAQPPAEHATATDPIRNKRVCVCALCVCVYVCVRAGNKSWHAGPGKPIRVPVTDSTNQRIFHPIPCRGPRHAHTHTRSPTETHSQSTQLQLTTCCMSRARALERHESFRWPSRLFKARVGVSTTLVKHCACVWRWCGVRRRRLWWAANDTATGDLRYMLGSKNGGMEESGRLTDGQSKCATGIGWQVND